MADIRKIIKRARGPADKTPEPSAPAPKAGGSPHLEGPMGTASGPVAEAKAPEAHSGGGAYGSDHEERQAFESAEHVIYFGTAPRVRFGQILTAQTVEAGGAIGTEAEPCCESPTGHAAGYIWGLGRRPKQMKGGLMALGAKDAGFEGDTGLYRALSGASEDLRRNSLEPSEGPFADKDGTIAEFADFIFEGAAAGDLNAHAERIIDQRAFSDPRTEIMQRRFFPHYDFTLNKPFEPPDELPYAGAILCQDVRLERDEVTGAPLILLSHPLEQYVLAVAALRQRGFKAYLAQAVMPDGTPEGTTTPLIAVLDLAGEVPLTTFDMLRAHPAMGAIDILSDMAAAGGLYAVLAEARIRHLCFHMVREAEAGREINTEEYANQLGRIARPLFESVKLWDGNPFIARAMMVLGNGINEASFLSAMIRFGAANSEQAAKSVQMFAMEILQSGTDPDLVDPRGNQILASAKQVASDAYHIGREAVGMVQMMLGNWIRNAKNEKPPETPDA